MTTALVGKAQQGFGGRPRGCHGMLTGSFRSCNPHRLRAVYNVASRRSLHVYSHAGRARYLSSGPGTFGPFFPGPRLEVQPHICEGIRPKANCLGRSQCELCAERTEDELPRTP
jgi:hypothetical protein